MVLHRRFVLAELPFANGTLTEGLPTRSQELEGIVHIGKSLRSQGDVVIHNVEVQVRPSRVA